MILEDLQFPQDYTEKSPNGYGLLFIDAFEPADSSLTFTVRDAYTGQVAIDRNNKPLVDLSGTVIELWDLDATNYPVLDLEVTFNSGTNRMSTPIFYGYSFGTEFGLTFNDLDRHRRLSVSDGEFDYVHDKGLDLYLSLIHI